MDSNNNNPTTELLNILSKAMDGKVYGSIEVYLEDGQVTQITQRIIKKINRTKNNKPESSKVTPRVKSGHSEISLKFNN